MGRFAELPETELRINMGLLDTKQRKALPSKDFGEPGSRKYPMPDKAHAVDAKARAMQAVNSGRMSVSTKDKIDAKANRVIKK